MHQLLVIDDNPIFGIFVQDAMGPDWAIITTTTGLDGITQLQQHPTLAAVVLDICMPGLDGYQTAAELRRMDQTVPIVPFTMIDPFQEDPLLPDYMRELGCAPIIRKGVDRQTFRQHLLDALTIPPQIHESAALRQWQRATYRKVQDLRRQTTTTQVVIYATSFIAQHGLTTLLTTGGDSMPMVVRDVTDSCDTLQHLRATACLDLVITTAADSGAVIPWAAQQCPPIPLVVLADTTNEGLMMTQHRQRTPTLPMGIVVATQGVLTQVPQAIAAVVAGSSYDDPALADGHATQRDHITRIIHHAYGVSPLKADEITLLQLELARWSNPDIVAFMHKTPNSVYLLRSRLCKKAQVPDITALLQTLEAQLP